MRKGGYLISKIHQLSGRIFTRKLKDYDICEINPAQGRILFALWEKDNISIQELAKYTALDKSTLTRMLDRLEESGHLERVVSEKDRRKILICLTEDNKQMKNNYELVSKEMTELFYQNFSEMEIDQFELMLQRIYCNLRKQEY